VAEDLNDFGVPEERDLLVAEGALLHDLAGAQRVTAVDHRHRAGKPGEEDCFLHGAVAAADHGNVLVAEEESVAGSAPGGTAARELLFTWNAELAVAGAGRDDHRASVEGLVAGLDHFRVGGEVHLGDVFRNELGSEPLSL